MSTLVQTRGGIPEVRRQAVTSVGAEYRPPQATMSIQVINEGGLPVQLFFSLADFTAGTNYVTVNAGGGVFSGPAELWPIAARDRNAELVRGGVWMKTTSGTSTVVVIFYCRRG